jgi:hypothetical protein
MYALITLRRHLLVLRSTYVLHFIGSKFTIFRAAGEPSLSLTEGVGIVNVNGVALAYSILD